MRAPTFSWRKSASRPRASNAPASACKLTSRLAPTASSFPAWPTRNVIRRVVETLKFPLNILAGANSPTIPRLRELGVARVSVGSGIMRASLGVTRRIAQELKASGTYTALLEGAMPFAEANALFNE